MKIICIVPISNNDVYASHFGKSIERFQLGVVNIGNDANNPSNDFIIRKMAIGISYAIEKNMIDNDTIVMFSREDVVVLDNFLPQKLDMVFSKNPHVGVVGIEGVDVIDRGWDFKFDKGHYIQAAAGEAVGNGNHIVHGNSVGYYEDCVGVGNSLFAVRGSLILSGLIPNAMQFVDDENIYSFDMCFQALSRGAKIAVADILIYDGSRKMFDSDYRERAKKQVDNLLNVFTSFGNNLPATVKSFVAIANEVVTIDL